MRAPEHVTETVEAIAKLHARAEEAVSRHQRAVEGLTARLSRPGASLLILVAAVLWMGANVIAPTFALVAVDPPPFERLQLVASLGALIVAATVLATQDRQRRAADERAALDLQVSLLAEQKVAKLIALVEELRRDLPNVRNRRDSEAEAMTQAVDADALTTALKESIAEAQCK